MKSNQPNVATFAAGCFWGVEEVFRQLPGVIDTEVGYTGGTMPAPTYERVCSGDTGHAEAVRVRYDPDEVSYNQLLDVFWNEHNPTQVGGQGVDIGEQYRSAIFYHDEEQKRLAEASLIRVQQEKYPGQRVATEITPASEFHRAEEYHQRYIAKKQGKDGQNQGS